VDRLYATCERGWFRLEPAFNATGAKGDTIRGPMGIQGPQYQQMAHLEAFAQCVRNKTRPEASGEEGLKDLQLIAAILQAAETGRKVMI